MQESVTITNPVPAPVRRLQDAITLADRAVAANAPADQFLKAHFRAHRNFGSRTRRTLADTVFAFFRWRGVLCPPEHPPDYARATALAYLLAVDTVDDWSKPWLEQQWPGVAALTGYARAPLAAKVAGLQALGCAVAPRAKWVPAWVAQLAVPWLDPFIDSLQERPPTWLRFRQGEREAGLAMYAAQAGGYPHPCLSTAAAIERALSREQYDKAGTYPFEFQDLASQCVGAVAAPRPGETWWDACAGAGGKSLQLADYMHNEGAIWATEPRRDVWRSFARRARRAGCEPMIRPQRGNALHLTPPEPVDGVLVDAPCSGLGRWAREPDARWRTPLKSVQQSARRQARLLAHVAPHIKSGGHLVYAVCTITPEETTRQAADWTAQQPGFEPVDLVHPLTGETTKSPLWIYPWDGPCGAMFIAKWRKK